MQFLTAYFAVNAAHVAEAVRTVGRWIRVIFRRADAVTQTTSG
jgi:hypothetical protein